MPVPRFWLPSLRPLQVHLHTARVVAQRLINAPLAIEKGQNWWPGDEFASSKMVRCLPWYLVRRVDSKWDAEDVVGAFFLSIPIARHTRAAKGVSARGHRLRSNKCNEFFFVLKKYLHPPQLAGTVGVG